jgi:hypothetical protein
MTFLRGSSSCSVLRVLRRALCAAADPALFFLPCAWAQVSSESGMPTQVTVRGVVLSTSDQKPIAGAAVQLSGNSMVMTDDQGRFEFTGVAVGKNAMIMTLKEGYLCPVLHVPVPPNCMQSIDVDVNYELQTSRDDADARAALKSGVLTLTLTLMPAAQVVGRVLDQTGAPIPNLTVALLKREIRDGRYELSLVGRSVKKNGWMEDFSYG